MTVGSPGSRPLRLLLVEDSEIDAEFTLRAIAQAGYAVVSRRVDSPVDMAVALGAEPWDVVLCDYMMPKFSGLDALSQVQSTGLDVPFILVSGAIGEDVAVEVMKAGAQDYVMKDRLARLGPAVERALQEAEARRARRRAEADLRKMAAAVEQSPVSVVITDREGNVEYVNPRFTELTGYTLPEVQGKSPTVLRSSSVPAEEYAAMWRTVGAGGTWRGRFHQRRKDGALFHEEASVSPIRDENGRITHYLQVGEDVTERLNLEEQVRQAQKMEVVGRLAASVAHDFNNLLTVIQGFACLVSAESSLEEPCREELDQILQACQRAGVLSRQLLALSRQRQVHLKPVDLTALVRGAEPMIRCLVREDVQLQFRLDDGSGTVMADTGQLEQAVANLVVNARDAMPQGGTLTVETSQVQLDKAAAARHEGLAPGTYARISITDTGVGMDEATLARIFEPFFTTKEVGKGTGLGLSTVLGIVRDGRGTVEVTSAPGKGTCIRILLPLAGTATESRAAADEGEAEAAGGTETVLVVDDDPAIRLLTRRLLGKAGYNVLLAASGGEALFTFEKQPQAIPLLVTDVVMPEVSGRQLAMRLKAVHPALKVLYISSHSDDTLHLQGLPEKGLHLLRKPFRAGELLRAVRAALDGSAT